MAAQSTVPEQIGQECFEQPPAHERLVLLPPAVSRFEALRQFNVARERLDLMETPQVATVAVTSEPGTAKQPSGSGAETSDDELWVAEYSDAVRRGERTAQAISDALRSAPFAPVPRQLLRKPQKSQMSIEDYIAQRIARSIYRLPVDAQRVANVPGEAYGSVPEYSEFAAQVHQAQVEFPPILPSRVDAGSRETGSPDTGTPESSTQGARAGKSGRPSDSKNEVPAHRAQDDKGQSKRGKIRAAWLDKKRSDREWTSDLDIVHNGGPTYNTIQRYRSGRESTRDAYVRGLFAKAFGCGISEVPE